MEFSTAPTPSDAHRGPPLGVLTQGSLVEGVEMKLDAGRSIEEVSTGTFAVVAGETMDFFCLITDARITAANDGVLLYPPPASEVLLRRVLHGTTTYATVKLKPLLTLTNGSATKAEDATPRPVKSVPAHFSAVYRASETDVARIFGAEANDASRFFEIGSPLDMDGVPVCVDLARFAERSSAVFGRTGTGKTFIARLLLAGLIKTRRAVTLVFDMHGDYGHTATVEHATGKGTVPGLAGLFRDEVVVVTLDPQRAGGPHVRADLYADDVEPEDLLGMTDTLNLTANAADTARLVQRTYKKRWLATLLRCTDFAALAEATTANQSSLEALARRLSRFDSDKVPFFHVDTPDGARDGLVDTVVNALKQRRSVVFQFGRFDDLTTYLLVANLISRRVRAVWEEEMEQSKQKMGEEPPPLVITIEEAHKFLGPGIASETLFGKIAREMRKFNVSLLVVDQRPSAIDDEVLSQIGTKFVAALSDDRDLSAVLVGTAGASALRGILATLDTKQQMLVLGHAVPMPIAVRTRSYDADFFQSVRAPERTHAEVMKVAEDEFGGGFVGRRRRP